MLWVRQEFEPDLRDAFPEMKAKGILITIKGTQGCQIVSGLAVAPSELRNGTAAFYGTTLNQILAHLRRDAFILEGSIPMLVLVRPPSMLTSEIGLSSSPQTALTRMIENITISL